MVLDEQKIAIASVACAKEILDVLTTPINGHPTITVHHEENFLRIVTAFAKTIGLAVSGR